MGNGYMLNRYALYTLYILLYRVDFSRLLDLSRSLVGFISTFYSWSTLILVEILGETSRSKREGVQF